MKEEIFSFKTGKAAVLIRWFHSVFEKASEMQETFYFWLWKMDLYIVRCALEIKTGKEIRCNIMIEMKNVGLFFFWLLLFCNTVFD